MPHGRSCPNRLSSRIIVVQAELDGASRAFGILAENVGLCEIREGTETAGHCGGLRALGSVHLDAQGVFQMLAPESLLGQDRRDILFPAAEGSPS